MAANSRLVWDSHPFIREQVIEKVLAVLQYNPASGYGWVGVLRQGKFRLIDYVNEFAREQISLKTVFRSTEEGWRGAEVTLEKHIRGKAHPRPCGREECAKIMGDRAHRARF